MPLRAHLPLGRDGKRGMLVHLFCITVQTRINACSHSSIFSAITFFEASFLPVSYRSLKYTLLYSHSFFSPDSSASQYPCLHPGCSYIGAHANDLTPHTKKHHAPIPNFLYRTHNWRCRADALMRNPHLRIHPNRQHVETSLLINQPSRSCSLEKTARSANQVIAISAPATAQFSPIQLIPQQPWLPFSETPRWPYSEQYTILQKSLRLRFRRLVKLIRTCHILIFLGFLTILGSLAPALWRSVARNDIQGGFSLAQYILGVGVFVIGCMVAIHSRTCTCWQ